MMRVSTSPPLLLLPLALLLLLPVAPAHGGHVLAFPGEFSHWLNMRTILEELLKRNHSVTVLVPDASPSINYNNSYEAAKFNFLVFKVSYSKEEYLSIMQEFIHFSMYESHASSLLHKFMKMNYFMGRTLDFGRQQCDGMLKNEQLMAILKDATFDAVLQDPMAMCGDLVAEVLGVPLILSLRFSIGSVMERHCGHAPSPPSYVPLAPLPYSDHMTFTERLINMVTYVASSLLTELAWKLSPDKYYSEIKGSASSVCETLGKADVWLIRTFWDIETPRPIPPNFKYVGGLHCKPANQLPEDLEEFVQSSGDAGVVVVSFGSMVTNLTMEHANVIATAFGQIPQKVIWRYRGNAPTALASNTKISNWIPQNDLLGHPKTRAFVTHGGTNGLYEAVFHGVPLVGIPLFGDQHDNLARMSRLDAAIVLDFNHLTAEELTEALYTVINQPSYRTKMQRLSAVQRDQPVTPLSTAVFWVEFVMRHGGARHLRLASHDLNWFQYHSLDTGAALLVALMTAAALWWTCIRSFLQRCRWRARREKKD
ncbi:UDP-glucuronosyltransferase 2C1-like isoform X2 [Archocentrus centrarchus]|uniref:UDP-glucuronosyltransferase 2C1-like isoform X1 n=1 Tax=Archocentrus centrarchus TaxID=63155 RepID=UPI0011EA4C8C|nr:UDP-glucuronosyltransferase 2C1-like isoform X1 [Archocentrus centrarchus]XP_030581591.1 UDP-glucuronosyltransferase 2C1-like isoform X2 [Archocentrus centrarchus]XP_030581592.1 UDP-glucuronosyltransferase 2C1-like isoform X1 [Archocentrus centrarchus]XP_030581593.1 UDP-glucuronosyltransferase 2C1-like isoform X2 [Archocentrus centrarchus]